MPDTIEDQAQQAMAKAGIRDLLDTYHGAINFRDWAVLAGLFTEDAIWEAEPPLNLRFVGKEAVLAGLQASVGRQQFLVQSSSGVLVDFEGPGQAAVRSSLIEFGKSEDGHAGWRAYAEYDDQVVREGGVWRFRRRSLYLRYQGESAAPGDVAKARSKS